MRILYFTQYFPPEVGATQTRAFEMAHYLASQGHTVTVVTEVPNHPSGIIPPLYRGMLSERKREDGIDVLRLWVWTSPEKTFGSRMRFYLSYMGMASLAGALIRGRYNLVYATSPPLFVGVAGLVAALSKRVPFVFEVRDLWPESAVALGELSNRRSIRAAERLELLLYKRARRIVAVTDGIRQRLIGRGIPPDKVALIQNGANVEVFRPDSVGAARVREELGLHGKFVVIYAGIHGVAQGLETLLQAAHILREHNDIAFVMVGEGPRKADLIRLRDELRLSNVQFLPEVPSKAMPAYLSAADCAIVPLRDQQVFRGALPSKMFEAWACARPVVLSVAGEAEGVLKEANGGLSVRPEDAAEMADAVLWLHKHRYEGTFMGENGRKYVEQHFSRQAQAVKLEDLLSAIVRADKTESRGTK